MTLIEHFHNRLRDAADAGDWALASQLADLILDLLDEPRAGGKG